MCCARAYWAWICTVFDAAAWLDCSDLFCDPGINEDMQNAKHKCEIKLTQILKAQACELWKEFHRLPDGALC